ncbi:Methionine--tRNA ligase, mitochondrial [Halocaridina rubra]|uniref:Methionine--tRNA ligase, mitochondrial n=1 Tax=Halocaridina rubra TaxID=373956 RepID=A0AAN9A7Z7_HALRR
MIIRRHNRLFNAAFIMVRCVYHCKYVRHLSSRENCSAKTGSYFITTPIFYVNAQPHIGHLHSALLADASYRFQLLRGREFTLFSTGTDEHGLKVQQAATNNNISPFQYCDEVSDKFRCLFDAANIGYTDFVRTVESRHVEAVQKFITNLMAGGHIYQGSYSGWYCVSDEAYLTDVQVKEMTTSSGQKQMVSIESGHPVEWNKEENYMFKLSSFQNDLLHWLKDDGRVTPKRFLEELRMWVSEGLIDLSISRPRDRVSWGIPVPGDYMHTVYVWVDALINYLTVAGYPELKLWPPDVQVIGKDILRFHGIYWPALLIASGLEPPRNILCHSHWTVEGQKMSKSLGNVVCPHDRIEKYTTDGLRYFLLRESTTHSDSNWSDTRLVRLLNAELADSLGNLLNRCTAPSLNPRLEFPKLSSSYLQTIPESGSKLMEQLTKLPDDVEGHYCNYNFYRAVDVIMNAVRSANVFVQEEKPWELKNLQDRTKLDSVLRIALETVRIAGIALQPIVPTLAGKVLDCLGILSYDRLWDKMKVGFSREKQGYFETSSSLGRRTKLFNKLKL